MKASNRSSNERPRHMKKSRNVLRYIALAVTGALIGFGLYLDNAEVIGRDPMPMPFGTGIAVVTTGSMEPALSVNDLLIVKKKEEYTEGDIVVYTSGSSMVVHRIIRLNDSKKDRKEEPAVILKGDANNTEDAPVAMSRIKGKVVFYIPALGALLRAVKSGTGLMILIIAGILIIELPFRLKKRENDDRLDEIRREISRLKEEQNERE